jgi:hypothetical protein
MVISESSRHKNPKNFSFKDNIVLFLALWLLGFFGLVSACSLGDDTLKRGSLLHGQIESLTQGALIYHGSLVPSFATDHKAHPTPDSRFPGGPSWFAPNIKALSIWRAAQLYAVNDNWSSDNADTIYLHQYKLSKSANILDLSEKESKDFFAKLEILYQKRSLNKNIRKSVNLALFYFEDHPEIDGFLIKDSVSGVPELVVKDPSKMLILHQSPSPYEISPEFSCFSCKPRRFIIRGADTNYALIPDSKCDPGYYIQRL